MQARHLASSLRDRYAVRATRFTDPASVDAWDDWFRWRQSDCLRDRTIDATWWRVANALVPLDRPEGQQWAERYVDAFSRWRLLPDERLLKTAGTDASLTPLESPGATINVAPFVIAEHSPRAHFDDEGFSRIAGLAVRLLDDAMTMADGAAPRAAALRIGLIGFADALDLLGIHYDDAGALTLASTIGKSLAMGTLCSSLELTLERGPLDEASAERLSLWRDRRVPNALIESAERRGIRHVQLTAIDSQPRLSLLANNASNALEPRPFSASGNRLYSQTSPADARSEMTCEAMVNAQVAIRSAIQPWIDAPIDYAPMAASEFDRGTVAFTRREPSHHTR